MGYKLDYVNAKSFLRIRNEKGEFEGLAEILPENSRESAWFIAGLENLDKKLKGQLIPPDAAGGVDQLVITIPVITDVESS